MSTYQKKNIDNTMNISSEFLHAVKSVQECCKDIIMTSDRIRKLHETLEKQNQTLIEADIHLNELISKMELSKKTNTAAHENTGNIDWQDFLQYFNK